MLKISSETDLQDLLDTFSFMKNEKKEKKRKEKCEVKQDQKLPFSTKERNTFPSHGIRCNGKKPTSDCFRAKFHLQ